MFPPLLMIYYHAYFATNIYYDIRYVNIVSELSFIITTNLMLS